MHVLSEPSNKFNHLGEWPLVYTKLWRMAFLYRPRLSIITGKLIIYDQFSESRLKYSAILGG